MCFCRNWTCINYSTLHLDSHNNKNRKHIFWQLMDWDQKGHDPLGPTYHFLAPLTYVVLHRTVGQWKQWGAFTPFTTCHEMTWIQAITNHLDMCKRLFHSDPLSPDPGPRSVIRGSDQVGFFRIFRKGLRINRQVGAFETFNKIYRWLQRMTWDKLAVRLMTVYIYICIDRYCWTSRFL